MLPGYPAGVAATSPPYPTPGWATTQVYPAQGSTRLQIGLTPRLRGVPSPKRPAKQALRRKKWRWLPS